MTPIKIGTRLVGPGHPTLVIAEIEGPDLLVTAVKSARAAEIEQLIQFIRNRDIRNARRMLVVLMGKGERISREIVAAYERLELK